MVKHIVRGAGPTFIDSFVAGAFAERILYGVATEMGIQNPDGTRTYLHGTGFVYDWAAGQVTGGTVTAIRHFDVNGALLDEVTDIATSAQGYVGLQTSGSSQLLRDFLFQGNDTLDARVRTGNAIVDDVLLSGAGDDVIYGGSGNDRLFGESGNDTLWGGLGNDRLDGGAGNDWLQGETGNDILDGNRGLVRGEIIGAQTPDHDVLSGGASHDILWGRSGNDVLDGGTGTDTAVYFGLFDDLNISKTASGFVVDSKDGFDTLIGVERIATNDGTYVWNATESTWSLGSTRSGVAAAAETSQFYAGGNGVENILVNQFSATYDDRVYSLAGGSDVLRFEFGAFDSVVVYGGSGNDTITVAAQKSAVRGNFHIDGGSANDVLHGGTYEDVLVGGVGNDRLTGGLGDDVLVGGAGADIFVFRPQLLKAGIFVTEYEMFGNDVIKDFEFGTDKLDLDPTLTTMTNTNLGLELTVGFVAPPNDNGTPTVFYGDRTILLEGVFGNFPIEMLLA